ncbi:MAG: hypothetical protein ACK5HZ_08955 [Macellibacteroides fermentans]|uniref:hypothetical protein n=1 Tax=Macellibacteroides fermentans TaxID=879969 RepID=UPI000A8A9228
MLQKAIDIATKAHEGQVDKAGQPYIDHPLRVMNMGTTDEEKIVGVLHDVVEDSDWTFEELAAEGFSIEVIEALRCITKLSENEPYDKFIQRVKANSLAAKVKLYDLTDNMDIRRLAYISEKDVKRLRKYLKAYRQLLGQSAYSIEVCRIEHPNAYKPWIREDDDMLVQLFSQGKTLKELSDIFQRKPGAIISRMKKLQLE